MFYELLHHLHYEHLLFLAQHVHLHNEDDFLVARKWLLNFSWKIRQRTFVSFHMNYSTTYMMSTNYSFLNLSTCTMKMIWVSLQLSEIVKWYDIHISMMFLGYLGDENNFIPCFLHFLHIFNVKKRKSFFSKTAQAISLKLCFSFNIWTI